MNVSPTQKDHLNTLSVNHDLLKSVVYQNIALAITSVILGAMAGYRVLGYGYDYTEYLSFYQGIGKYFTFEDTRFEPGYVFLARLFKVYFSASYGLFTTIVISVSLFIKLNLLKKYSGSNWLFIISYIMIFYPLHEYTQVRISIAITFSLLSVHFLLNKKYLLNLIVVLISISFHYSITAIYVPIYSFYFINRFFSPKSSPYILILLGVISLFSFNISFLYQLQTFFPILQSYLTKFDAGTSEGSVKLFTPINILLYVTLAAGIFKQWYLEKERLIFLYIIAFGIFSLALFQNIPVIANRLAEAMAVATIPAIFYRLDNFFNKIMALSSLVAGCYLVYSFYESGILG